MKKPRSYSEKLKDPRWHRLRFRVMERAGWRCENCSAADEPLEVYFGYYERGLAPWEYDAQTLWSLCHDCMKIAAEARRDILFELGHICPPRLCPGDIWELRRPTDDALSFARGDLARSDASRNNFRSKLIAIRNRAAAS